MKRLLRLMGLLAAVLPALVLAQTTGVTLSVRVGLNGVAKQNSWIPATFVVGNTGTDVQAEIEWRWDNGGQVYAQSVDLPHGANKQIILPVRSPDFGGHGTARVLVGARVVAKAAASADVADGGQLLLAAAGDDAAPIVGLLGTAVQGRPSRSLQLSTVDLPERPEFLQAVSWLILSGDTGALHAEQRSALLAWVQSGGHLVIDGARAATALGLAELAPATVSDTSRTGPVGQLLAGAVAPAAGEITVLELVPRAGATAVSGAGGIVPLVRQARGSGSVVQLGFSLARLVATGVPASFWAPLVALDPSGLAQPQATGSFLEQALRLPALRLPSLSALLAFLLGYILLVGPVNYLLLRRWDRREWAYFTIPLTVLLFTLGAYIWGTAGRGSGVVVSGLTIVHATGGSSTGEARTEVGVYSPTRRSYTVSFPPDALVAWSSSDFRRTATGPLRTLRTETAVDAPGVLVDVGSLQSLTAEQTIPVPAVRVTQSGGPQAAVLVQNTSNQTLQDVIVLQDRAAVYVGNLAPGAEQRVTVPPGASLDAMPPTTTGTIDRRAVVMALVEGIQIGQAGPPGPPPQVAAVPAPLPPTGPPLTTEQPLGLSVLAWLPAAPLAVQIDHRPPAAQAETLLIVGVEHATTR